jgi:hypothetical protein
MQTVNISESGHNACQITSPHTSSNRNIRRGNLEQSCSIGSLSKDRGEIILNLREHNTSNTVSPYRYITTSSIKFSVSWSLTLLHTYSPNSN